MININPVISSLIVRSTSTEKAIVIGQKSYTYQNIYEDSRKLATYLSSMGIQSGDTALVATSSSYQFILIFYASILLKVKIAIIDPEIDNEAYLAKIDQLNPQWAFIDRKLLFLQEHDLLKKISPNRGINNIDLPSNREMKIIATGAWRPLMRSYQHFEQYKIHPTYDIDPSFIDHEYIISYTSTGIDTMSSTLHTLGTIAYSINFISRTVQDAEQKSFTTHLPHFIMVGISAGLTLKLWNDHWTAEKKIEFIASQKISVLSVAQKVLNELIEFCKIQKRMLPNCIEHIILDTSVENNNDMTAIEEYFSENTKITMMYSKADHLYEVY